MDSSRRRAFVGRAPAARRRGRALVFRYFRHKRKRTAACVAGVMLNGCRHLCRQRAGRRSGVAVSWPVVRVTQQQGFSGLGSDACADSLRRSAVGLRATCRIARCGRRIVAGAVQFGSRANGSLCACRRVCRVWPCRWNLCGFSRCLQSYVPRTVGLGGRRSSVRYGCRALLYVRIRIRLIYNVLAKGGFLRSNTPPFAV